MLELRAPRRRTGSARRLSPLFQRGHGHRLCRERRRGAALLRRAGDRFRSAGWAERGRSPARNDPSHDLRHERRGLSPRSPATRRSTTSSSRSRRRASRASSSPTASGDRGAQMAAFRSTFGARACQPRHRSLFCLEDESQDLARADPLAAHRLRRRRLDAQPARDLARARAGRDPPRLSARQPVGALRRPARAPGRSTSTRSRAARSRPATAPTMASGCCSGHQAGADGSCVGR